jgi:hypothetical protein
MEGSYHMPQRNTRAGTRSATMCWISSWGLSSWNPRPSPWNHGR